MRMLIRFAVLCLVTSSAHAQLGRLGDVPRSPISSPTITSMIAASRAARPPYAVLQARRAEVNRWLAEHRIQPRASWSGEVCPVQAMDNDWDYTTVTIHHSGNYGITDPQAILRMHTRRNGWSDIGYHFMVQPDGTILEARPLIYKGSHVRDNNAQKIGIIILGNFQPQIWNLGRADAITAPARASAVRLIRALRELFPMLRRMGGHRDHIVNPAETRRDCPGDNLYQLLPDLRQATGLRGP